MKDVTRLIPVAADTHNADDIHNYVAQPALSTAENSRRDAIKFIAMFCGLALSANSLSALAAMVSPVDMTRRKKAVLDKNQLALLRELGEIIIPTTDTPGAIAAGVHDFINYFVAQCATLEEQEQLHAILTRINSASGKPFLSLNSEQQHQLLHNMEQAKEGFNEEDRAGFKQLKALVIFGYYTSEIGGSQELAYLPIPGGYKGNFKFKEIGKAWALPF